MGLFDGRVVIITGASKGIGRVASQHFAREGGAWCVSPAPGISSRKRPRASRRRRKALPVVCDAAEESSVRGMVDTVVKTYGRIDVLVNNAGDGGPTKRVQDYTVEDWFYTINSCLTSSYLCIRFVVPEMIRVGGGAIVNISSGAGRRGLPYRIGYCSAKAGQVGMAYCLALELGPQNIRVNAIAPGAVEGDRIDRVIAGQAAVKGISEEAQRQAMMERTPLRRMTTADDIASTAVFLCSDLARNISGQCVAVNAGEPAG